MFVDATRIRIDQRPHELEQRFGELSSGAHCAIEVNVGRTGAVTPYGELEPVKLAGTTVKMATLHNEQDILRKDIRAGDIVLVEKAGDVIPRVVKPITSLRPTGADEPQPFVMPTTCPRCGTPLHKEPDEAVWRCVNTACPALAAR